MTALKGFRIVVFLGVLVNAAFWVPALFAPQVINDIFGFDSDYYTVWMRNVGMVLLLVSITNAAAAIDPRRYQLFAWLVVIGRYIAALFFFGDMDVRRARLVRQTERIHVVLHHRRITRNHQGHSVVFWIQTTRHCHIFDIKYGIGGREGSQWTSSFSRLMWVVSPSRIVSFGQISRADSTTMMGSGNRARINWELKFARSGVGAIISSFVPVALRGRIVPNYATIHRDEHIPFWRELGERVHEYDCKYIMQLSHSGRQRDIRGIEHAISLSSTAEPESLHGFECERMSIEQIRQTVEAFAHGARRARAAGLDGVELHGANGYLITQFLSSAINDRKDDYGGSLENRARFLREIVGAIRAEVGNDFHLQVKISATEYNNDVFPWESKGNGISDSIQVCKWLEADGVDAIHVSRRQYVSASPKPCRRHAVGNSGRELWCNALERQVHIPKSLDVPQMAISQHLSMAMDARPWRTDRGHQPA